MVKNEITVEITILEVLIMKSSAGVRMLLVLFVFVGLLIFVGTIAGVAGDVPQFQVVDFQEEFPDGAEGRDYGIVFLKVQETAGVEAENIEVTLEISGEKRGRMFEQTEVLDRLSASEEFGVSFEVGPLESADRYRAQVYVEADGARTVRRRVEFEVKPVVTPADRLRAWPELEEIQDAAMRYNHLHPQMVENWKRRLRQKIWIPDLSFRYRQDESDLTRLTDATWPDDTIGPRPDDYYWQVDLGWDLSDNFMDSLEEQRISREARSIRDDREEMLYNLTELYFDIEEDLVEMVREDVSGDRAVVYEMQLRRKIARIDAVTGGYFSQLWESNLRQLKDSPKVELFTYDILAAAPGVRPPEDVDFPDLEPPVERDPEPDDNGPPAVYANGININTATASELEDLPGVGPARAEDIVAHREQVGYFEDLWDLEEVWGIGPSLIEDLE